MDRPALATVFPTAANTATIMLDVGANVDCKPQNLQQFAIMGDIYFRTIFSGRFRTGQQSSRGAAVRGRGRDQGQRPDPRRLPTDQALPMNFLGNVEGRDLYNGRADVIVCDGFVGNVALKVSEGLVEAIRAILKEAAAGQITRQMGFLLARNAFQDFKKRLDYSEYGGAPLLGLKGVAIVSHGSSNGTAIKNAIRVAVRIRPLRAQPKIEEQIRAARSECCRGVGRKSLVFFRSFRRGGFCCTEPDMANRIPGSRHALPRPGFAVGRHGQGTGSQSSCRAPAPLRRPTRPWATRLSALCFEGPDEELRLTEKTQPAILTVSVAAARVLAEVGIVPSLRRRDTRWENIPRTWWQVR